MFYSNIGFGHSHTLNLLKMDKELSLITKLNNSNYFHWKQKMEMLLLKENLWETTFEERPNESQNLSEWDKKNNQARGLIGLSIENTQLIHIKDKRTAKDMWTALKEVHERQSLTTSISIMKRLCKLQMDEYDDVEKHIDIIWELIQQLRDMGATMDEQWTIAILLSSLPESFDSITDALEARAPRELTWTLVTSKLIDTWKRRKERFEQNDGKEKLLNLKGTRNDLFCHYCKKLNHRMKDCIFLKRKMEKEKRENDAESSKSDNENDEANYILNLSEKEANKADWVIDSGSSRHICNDKNLFTKIEKI